jgi:hypothetical protein
VVADDDVDADGDVDGAAEGHVDAEVKAASLAAAAASEGGDEAPRTLIAPCGHPWHCLTASMRAISLQHESCLSIPSRPFPAPRHFGAQS